MMIIPSLYGYSSQLLYNDVVELCKCGVSRFHFDIFDETVHKQPYSGLDDICYLNSIFDKYKITKNTHIVSRQPWRYFSTILEDKVEEVILHPHLLDEHALVDAISFLKDHKIRIGLSLTNTCDNYSLGDIDFIHVCNYDYYYERPISVKQICAIISEFKNRCNKSILVDGGVNQENISDYRIAGASFFVCGRSLFSQKPIDAYNELMNLIK